ncbi:alpha/beta fold hydrolase [Actinoplanes xinjiangensis]|uniref:Pimeloyl-ACP methyl ester carboxylesterase n=1 Tax=Actinoplanes xinjiangensis TaxID=512350 RepID=A0A316F935_9ACTN|nr:alpha/beta hydrolase [Actinoplanes xinjiangensis]PWK44265.1 pimeloyl-ACP methyl ester carboxylesterase [Actinoplanes xinjiangensis]GIF37979.1 alpha/beta hydrolase [Actinoplanes xinjiangensis]
MSRFEIPVDDRVLTAEVTGAPDGTPVFLLHGTPGSCAGPKPRSSVLYRQGVRLICHDRPGYGGSTRMPGRRVADAAQDVRAVADQLGVDRFCVVGRSGGGPHALACAALLPDRVMRAAVLVGLAPADAVGLDWYAGMSADNARNHAKAEVGDAELMRDMIALAVRTAADPESLLEELRTQAAEPDLLFMQSVMYRRLLTASYAEALRVGPYGWIDDILAFRGDWGFPVDQIVPPVRLWHGADDTFSPVSHSRWLADRIPRAEVHVQYGAAHFAAVEVLPKILTWLTA